MSASYGYLPDQDPLHLACERLWVEIRGLLPRYRWLEARGWQRTPEQSLELGRVRYRLGRLRALSVRYREVLRDEAWARHRAGEDAP